MNFKKKIVQKSWCAEFTQYSIKRPLVQKANFLKIKHLKHLYFRLAK